MSKELLLLRHAKSDWHTTAADFDRPLNARGRRDAPRMGKWLADNDYIPQVIIGSPAARAAETIELAAAAMQTADTPAAKTPPEIHYEPRLYHSGEAFIRELAWRQLETHARILIVAHNPGLAQAVLAYDPMAMRLLEDAGAACGKLMPTCGLAILELKSATAGRLRVLMRPAML